ncbi:MAG: hypothetical protein KC645_06350, partial [Gemmatimonadetes bacterium]|nr:hypothetical protein [Gemmatimonadota bacterium]
MNRRLPQRIARFWTVAVLLAPAHAAPQEAPAIAAGDLPASFVQAVDLEALLPQSSVYDILEDRDGFLWFATREGVARWDGREVRTWRHDPLTPGSLPGNIVRSLRQDRSGDVWAVAYDYLQVPAGVARIRAPGFTVVERMGFAGATVALSARGEPVLVGADSLWRFDPRTSSFQPWMPRAAPAASGADDQTPSRTLLDRSGQLWLADEGGLERCRLEPPEGCVALPFGEGVLALAGGPLLQTRDGTVWLGTASGVARWAPDAHPAQDAPTLLTLGVAPASLAEDSAGVVWVLSNDGVDRVEAGRVRARSSLPVLGTRSELAPVVLHVDRAQNVWVGTVWGVFMHARAHKPFHHLEHVPDDPRSLGSGLVTALAEAPGGAVWVGTIGGGLNRWDRRTGVVRHFRAAPGDPGALPSDVIWDLAVDARGVLWVATSEGLGRFVPETGRFRVYRRVAPPPPPTLEGSPNSIPDLQPDRSGRVWTSCATPCADTLAWFDGDAETFRLVPVP